MKRTRAIELRAEVWDKSGGRCYHCGKDMHPIREFTVDHLLPLIAGGTDAPSNLVGSCLACNFDKRAKVPDGMVPVPRAPRPDNGPAYLTTPEAAIVLGTNADAVRSWLRSGELSGKFLGKPGWRVSEEELRRFMENGEHEADATDRRPAQTED